ncbi:MAG: GGDEF domain-containing protein [Candidatus Omnitrophica bacterium]|nr:GGDEF domain-containing protein [Candidatus Omnitrophota bacterium]
MFRIKVICAIIVIVMVAFFSVMYERGALPFATINVLLSLIAPSAYLLSGFFSAAVLIIAWFAVFPLLIIAYHIDLINVAFSLAIFSALLAGYFVYRVIENREERYRLSALKSLDDRKSVLSDELNAAVRFENGMRAKELSFVNLYEITRKMSEYLKFEDIFASFSSFLKENISFRKCDLFILERSDEGPRLDRAYHVWYEEPAGKKEAVPVDYDKLIELFADGRKELFMAKDKNARELEGLGIDGDVDTYVAFSLLNERKVSGILAIENISKPDLEKFAILAVQFSLELKKVLLYETVEKLAITDSLTGLYVRRYFCERLEEEIQRSGRYKFEFAFIMIDIDDFKKCNDTFGHLVGDVVIKDIARIIKESVREIDIVARYGGEEFSVVLPETGRESAFAVAERLRKKIEENSFRAYDENLKLTVSMGFTISKGDTLDMKEVTERADAALYEAKKIGKNVVREYKR